MRIVLAWFAGKLSVLTNMLRRKRAVTIVGVKRYQSPKPIRVYDLTVEKEHVFYANGVLVSNCADSLQYLCLHANPSYAVHSRARGAVEVKRANYRY